MSALALARTELDLAAHAALADALDRWGTLAPQWRGRILDALMVAAASLVNRWRLDPAAAAEEALTMRVAAWAAVLPPTLRNADMAALRAAYLAMDGARHWPEALLGATRMPGFGEALRQAVPVPMPAPAPLAMPVQTL